jgi:hypothetical protein
LRAAKTLLYFSVNGMGFTSTIAQLLSRIGLEAAPGGLTPHFHYMPTHQLVN